MRKDSDKSCRENKKRNFFKTRAIYEVMLKNIVEPTGHRWQYGAWALHAGYPRLRTQTHNMSYLFLFHYNNGYTKAPQYYVTLTLPVMLTLIFPGTGRVISYDSEMTKHQVKSKQSLYIPGHAPRLVRGTESRFSKQSAHGGSKIIILSTGRFYLPADNPGTHLRYMLSRPQGNSASRRIK